MANEYLEPAKSVLAKIGIEKAAEITGKHISRIYRWMYPKERGGTGGLIPQNDQPVLLQYAQDNHLDLSPADFFPTAAPKAAALDEDEPANASVHPPARDFLEATRERVDAFDQLGGHEVRPVERLPDLSEVNQTEGAQAPSAAGSSSPRSGSRPSAPGDR